jgi:obg-like ATPase 1
LTWPLPLFFLIYSIKMLSVSKISTYCLKSTATKCLFSTSNTMFAKKKVSKVQQTEEKVILGRPSNNLRMGVVGLPNIGLVIFLSFFSLYPTAINTPPHSKSSLFNALTNSSVPAENYPFCTIDPSEARVEVPDARFDWLVNSYQPKKITPAHVSRSFPPIILCVY